MPIDIRNVDFGERGFPVEDLTAKTKYESGFRVGRFDFPCIAVSDISKFVSAIVVNRMELPEHKYHGYLIVAPLLTRITQYGIEYGTSDEEDTTTNAAYQSKKVFVVNALNINTITKIQHETKIEAGCDPYGLKVTRIIDGGSEVTVFEVTSGLTTSYVWRTSDFTGITGNIITFNVYIKGDGVEAVFLKGFRIYGEVLSEISGEKFTVDHGEYI